MGLSINAKKLDPEMKMDPDQPIVDVIKLDFGYDPNVPVIKDINVTLDKPEFVCIMGPNGVGKSTLIHCMNRILRFTNGTIMIGGNDTKDMRLKELSSYMGYVPASSEDTFPLTVVDTVMVGLQNDFKFGTNDEDLKRVYETLRMMKIEHLAMRNFNELSAGQHQKVMLARGLVRTPRIVLLDEPTSNLDIKHQIDVTKTLSMLPKAKGMLVIMISHDINITAKFADRIIMLSGGGVFADGTPAEVLTKENIRTVYGVDADVIEVDGRPHIILNDCLEDAYIPTDLGPVDD
jgi:iron complex transport system ATP-binding protein